MRNEDVLRKMGAKRTPILKIGKKRLKFLRARNEKRRRRSQPSQDIIKARRVERNRVTHVMRSYEGIPEHIQREIAVGLT